MEKWTLSRSISDWMQHAFQLFSFYLYIIISLYGENFPIPLWIQWCLAVCMRMPSDISFVHDIKIFGMKQNGNCIA